GMAEQIASIDPVEGFLAKARVSAYRKETAKTEAMLREAVQIRPESYKAQTALAEFYLAPEHRNDEAAESAAKAALNLDPSRVSAYSVLAAVYAGRGEWNALDGILAASARELPEDLTPMYRAAERLVADDRDPARAERYLRLYLAQEPEGNQPTVADAQ